MTTRSWTDTTIMISPLEERFYLRWRVRLWQELAVPCKRMTKRMSEPAKIEALEQGEIILGDLAGTS